MCVLLMMMMDVWLSYQHSFDHSCLTNDFFDFDLVPWRCSCRDTQRQLGYGSSPGVCLGQDGSHRVQSGPCQHSCSWLHRAILEMLFLIYLLTYLLIWVLILTQFWRCIELLVTLRFVHRKQSTSRGAGLHVIRPRSESSL